MAFPQSLPPDALRLRPFTASDAEREAEPAEAEAGAGVWAVIWSVGGLCWLVVTGTALLWMAPISGLQIGGYVVITSAARAVQHLFVFLVAAIAYRIALELGWPDGLMPRARVVALNTLLALAVVAFGPIALALAGGLVDARFPEMRQTLTDWSPLTGMWQFWASPLRFFLLPYVLGLCAIALVLMRRRQHREALRSARLASACAAARMAMLSAQLQPHFLFNSLHAISVLIEDSPRQASAMLARLGDFLRHALESSHWPWTDVATELGGLEAYLAVQQMRFSDRLRIAIDASPESLPAMLPALLLQPLAENAIDHGRDDSGAVLNVRVASAVVAGRLRLTVHNSTPQLPAVLPPAGYGHGLQNVELRLRAAYGSDAHLRVAPDPQGGTTAYLDLPHREFAGAARLRRAAP
jgi:cytochrome c-type biogenesis protein CcmH/NrfF